MNKRQRKKDLKKWLERVVYTETEPLSYEPISVGLGAWRESLREVQLAIARAFVVPPHMIFGHRLGGYARPQLLLAWDGPRPQFGKSPLPLDEFYREQRLEADMDAMRAVFWGS